VATMTVARLDTHVHLGAGRSFIPTDAPDVAVVVFVVVALLAIGLASLARSRAVETDQRRREAEASRDELGVLAEHQAALRRIATLVAEGVPPSEVFSAVVAELALCPGVHHSILVRFEPDGASRLIAANDQAALEELPVPERSSPEDGNVAAIVFGTGRAARRNIDEKASGPAEARVHGVRSTVGAPVIVDGRLWGAAIVGSSRPEPLPADTEARLGDFAHLTATAISKAQTRADLSASRARIVAAADSARRRFERDLHDGAQQRLVSLGLELRTAEDSLRRELHPLTERISHIGSGLAGISKDLQEISRGIHPAILSNGGLGPALKELSRRSAVPVKLDVGIDRRLPESAEVAAYYVVAEALTNAAKHARASAVNLRADIDGANLRLSIRDDGIGGADLAKGSGIIGLTDRVEAIGGQLEICSPAGSGTSLRINIPLESRETDHPLSER
jgi:signal transduction histidine kinase